MLVRLGSIAFALVAGGFAPQAPAPNDCPARLAKIAEVITELAKAGKFDDGVSEEAMEKAVRDKLGEEYLTCPVTKQPYVMGESAIMSTQAVGVVIDAMSHPDGSEYLVTVGPKPPSDWRKVKFVVMEHRALMAQMEKARDAETNLHACQANLTAIAKACRQYASHNKGLLPPLNSKVALKKAFTPYLDDLDVLVCPESGVPYRFNTTLAKKKLPKNAASVALAFDAKPHADGKKVVALANGRVKIVNARTLASFNAKPSQSKPNASLTRARR